MSQLPSSIRLARGALKYPTTWRNWTHYQTLIHQHDATISKKMTHNNHLHISTRAIASGYTTARSSIGETGDRNNNTLMGNGLLYELKYHHWRQQPFSWTMQHMISTSTTLLDPNETNKKLSGEEGNVSIPFQRSKRARKPKSVASSGFDDRAQAKLEALSKAKSEADDAKALFSSSTTAATTADDDDDHAKELHARWNASEKQLATAYSQAIKYTSRITKNEEATKTAERLLFEWMGRFLDPFGVSSSWTDNDDEKDATTTDSEELYLNRKRMVRTFHNVLRKLSPSGEEEQSSLESKPAVSAKSSFIGEDVEKSSSFLTTTPLPKIRIPPPSSKDYINLLRAYSISKAKRKGQQCEVLMRNMMQLAKNVAFYYDENDEEWTNDRAFDVGMESVMIGDGKETEMWRLWVNDSVPNSKVFALAIKCYAGTTHNEALERIVLLNQIHDAFTDSSQSHIPGMYKDDPYVLFHSIKSLKNLQKREQWDKGHQWLYKLHTFVTSPENANYFQEKEEEGSDGGSEWEPTQPTELEGSDATTPSPPSGPPSVFSRTIDVTSAYTTFIRLLARLRGKSGAAADALDVLNRMHRVQDVFANGLAKPRPETPPADETSENVVSEEVSRTNKSIAYVDIRSNAYNLVLGLYRDSNKVNDGTNAIGLLQRMVDAGNQAPEERKGVPLPTEQSFEYTMMSLANMSNAEKAIQEAERLIQLMQDQNDLQISVSVYNAYITVCNRQLHGKSQLYDKALEILDEMTERGKTNPKASPDPETLALVMKACSLSEHDDHARVLATASRLFSSLEEREPSETSATALTDRAYYYMMKCVDAHHATDEIDDPNGKKDRIEELFSEACQRGLCSANVLEMFRKSVTEEEYKMTVGKGRLADKWIANIKGPRALYTDGSRGGAGKHARRKGKSTSDWAKKKKEADDRRGQRRKDKKAKKFFKKKMNVAN